MGRCFEYKLPWPPSMNTYWRSRIVGFGRSAHIVVHISPKGEKYRKDVISKLEKVANTKAKLKLDVAYLRPDNRIRDLDNYQKALYDALKHGRVYQDDCQIVDKHEYWVGVDPLGIGGVVIRIEELT